MDDPQKMAIAQCLSRITPRVRAGIVEYLEKAGTVTQREIADKHGFNIRCITTHLNRLEELGVVVDRRISTVTCEICGQPISAHVPKIYLFERNPTTDKLKKRGGMHTLCFEKVRLSAPTAIKEK